MQKIRVQNTCERYDRVLRFCFIGWVVFSIFGLALYPLLVRSSDSVEVLRPKYQPNPKPYTDLRITKDIKEKADFQVLEGIY